MIKNFEMAHRLFRFGATGALLPWRFGRGFSFAVVFHCRDLIIIWRFFVVVVSFVAILFIFFRIVLRSCFTIIISVGVVIKHILGCSSCDRRGMKEACRLGRCCARSGAARKTVGLLRRSFGLLGCGFLGLGGLFGLDGLCGYLSRIGGHVDE